MHRTLIVAHMDQGSAENVADIFERSDHTDLPRRVGVTRRSLFTFHDLYFHLIESDEGIASNLERQRSSELYRQINTQLAQHISPYDPNWKEPKDAMAKIFYDWNPNDGRVL